MVQGQGLEVSFLQEIWKQKKLGFGYNELEMSDGSNAVAAIAC